MSRFRIGSSLPDTGSSVLDELISDVPAQPSAPDVNKFVDAPATLPIAQVLSQGKVPTLEDCEQQIAHVTNQWLIGTSEALAYIHENELWKKSKGGVIYDSWKGYLRHRLDMTPQRAHQLMKARRSALAVAPVAKSEIKEGHTRVLDKIYEAVGKNDKLPDEAAAAAACKKVWLAAAKASGRPSAAALERAAVREGFLSSAEEPEKPELPPPPPPAWQRIAPALQVVQDLDTWKNLVKDAPAKGFEAAYYLMKAANEIGNDLGEERLKLLHQAVMDGKLPEKLDF